MYRKKYGWKINLLRFHNMDQKYMDWKNMDGKYIC